MNTDSSGHTHDPAPVFGSAFKRLYTDKGLQRVIVIRQACDLIDVILDPARPLPPWVRDERALDHLMPHQTFLQAAYKTTYPTEVWLSRIERGERKLFRPKVELLIASIACTPAERITLLCAGDFHTLQNHPTEFPDIAVLLSQAMATIYPHASALLRSVLQNDPAALHDPRMQLQLVHSAITLALQEL